MCNILFLSFCSLLGIIYTHGSGLFPSNIPQDHPGQLNLAVMNLTSGKSSHEAALRFELPTNNNANVATERVHDSNTVRHASIETPNNVASQTEITKTKEPESIFTENENILESQIEEFKRNYNEGRRVMVILRGAPGSGKTYLARKLLNTILRQPSDHNNYTFAIDDFFVTKEGYFFDVNKIFQALRWNFGRVLSAAQKSLNPIIVENVNLQCWHMEPYLRVGFKNGYVIQIMEPRTAWAQNATELYRRNVHGASVLDIKQFLAVTEDCTEMFKEYNVSYPTPMTPSAMRRI